MRRSRYGNRHDGFSAAFYRDVSLMPLPLKGRKFTVLRTRIQAACLHLDKPVKEVSLRAGSDTSIAERQRTSQHSPVKPKIDLRQSVRVLSQTGQQQHSARQSRL